MFKDEFKNQVVVGCALDKYLVIPNAPELTEIIGKPQRIVLSKEGIIPEFEERDLKEEDK